MTDLSGSVRKPRVTLLKMGWVCCPGNQTIQDGGHVCQMSCSPPNKQSKDSSRLLLLYQSISKVLWPQKDSPSLCLKGEPVFIQVCLLGQLLQTELFSPVFPLMINTTLAFDRVNIAFANQFLLLLQGFY